MLQHSRYHAVQLWLGGSPWEAQQRAGSCDGVKLQSAPPCLSHVVVSRQTGQTDCWHAVAIIEQP